MWEILLFLIKCNWSQLWYALPVLFTKWQYSWNPRHSISIGNTLSSYLNVTQFQIYGHDGSAIYNCAVNQLHHSTEKCGFINNCHRLHFTRCGEIASEYLSRCPCAQFCSLLRCSVSLEGTNTHRIRHLSPLFSLPDFHVQQVKSLIIPAPIELS